MPITTQAKVEAILGRALTAAEVGYLPERLNMAESAILDAFPGLVFADTTVTDEDNVVGQDSDVWTDSYPIRSVTALAVNGVDVDLSDLVITDGFAALVMPTRSAVPSKEVGGWRAGDRIVISYTAGYESSTVPDHVANVAAEMIAVGFDTPLSVRQETLGDHSVSYAGGAASTPAALRKRFSSLARRITSNPMSKGSL